MEVMKPRAEMEARVTGLSNPNGEVVDSKPMQSPITEKTLNSSDVCADEVRGNCLNIENVKYRNIVQ